jgi:Flp pilus assembly pilin Flp
LGQRRRRITLVLQRPVGCASHSLSQLSFRRQSVISTIRQLWVEEQGQDVAEYAVMLAVILVIVIGTVRLIGGNANNVFSEVSSQMAQ